MRHSDDSKLGGGDRWENVKQGRCKILAWYVLIAEGEGCLNVRFLCPLSATWKRGCLGGKGVSPDMKVMSGLYTDTDTLILIVQILPVSELLVEG